MNNSHQPNLTLTLEQLSDKLKDQKQIVKLTKEQESAIQGGCGCYEIRVRRPISRYSYSR